MLKSPGYTPPTVAVDGDKIMVVRKYSDGDGPTGYQLPAPPGLIRLASLAVDDNRTDPPEDWWRATYRADEVRVELLQRRNWAFV